MTREARAIAHEVCAREWLEHHDRGLVAVVVTLVHELPGGGLQVNLGHVFRRDVKPENVEQAIAFGFRDWIAEALKLERSRD